MFAQAVVSEDAEAAGSLVLVLLSPLAVAAVSAAGVLVAAVVVPFTAGVVEEEAAFWEDMASCQAGMEALVPMPVPKGEGRAGAAFER